MKNLITFALVAAGLAAAVPGINAAIEKSDGAADNATSAPSPALKHPRMHAAMQRRAELQKHLAKKLDLNTDQIAKLKAAREKTHASLKALRADASLTADQKKAKARETLQSARAEMRAVLTPDQQAKLDAMRAKIRAHAHKK